MLWIVPECGHGRPSQFMSIIRDLGLQPLIKLMLLGEVKSTNKTKIFMHANVNCPV